MSSQVLPMGEIAVPANQSEQLWYAVQTYARHEKAVAERMRTQGLNVFLPLVKEVHRWSDRRKTVQLPLFSCYVFVQMYPTNEDRLKALKTDGVLALVGVRGEGTPIPEEQIAAVRTLVTQDLPWSTHGFLKVGQRVRVRGGALEGTEGIFLSKNGENSLVISVDAIHRSLAIRIDGYDVEPL
jgi:transcription antitermination factor NusG